MRIWLPWYQTADNHFVFVSDAIIIPPSNEWLYKRSVSRGRKNDIWVPGFGIRGYATAEEAMQAYDDVMRARGEFVVASEDEAEKMILLI